MIDYIPLSMNSYCEFTSVTALGSLELPSDSSPKAVFLNLCETAAR